MTITNTKAFSINTTRDELTVLMNAVDYVLDMDSENFTPFDKVLMTTIAVAIEKALTEEV